MVKCSKCGEEVENASLRWCPNCGAPLTQQPRPTQPTVPLQVLRRPLPYQTGHMAGAYTIYGYIIAFLGLFIFPEILCSVAILMGAYTFRSEPSGSNRGLLIIILGIVCMLIGIYYTAYLTVGDFLP
jgi:DNA-directed RNA polymerase subunit RPC12/RpoP